jgi:hypothetical protein
VLTGLPVITSLPLPCACKNLPVRHQHKTFAVKGRVVSVVVRAVVVDQTVVAARADHNKKAKAPRFIINRGLLRLYSFAF